MVDATLLIERAVGETVPVVVTLYLDGAAVDFTAATITFYLLDSQYWQGEDFDPPYSRNYTPALPSIATLKVDGATCTGTSAGVVTWNPTVAQMDTPGDYLFQYKVVYADATIELFPKRVGEYRFRIWPGLPALSV